MSHSLFFLNKQMVLAINQMCISLTGGLASDQNNVRPGQGLAFIDQIYQNELFGMTLYPDLFHQAAAYFFYILKNHTFVDGNKRTALACALTFLQWNGIQISHLNEEAVFEYVMSAAASEDIDDQIPKIATWLKTLAKNDG